MELGNNQPEAPEESIPQSQQSPPSAQQSNKNNSLLYIGGIVVVLAIIGIGYYIFAGHSNSNNLYTNQTSSTAQTNHGSTTQNYTTVPSETTTAQQSYGGNATENNAESYALSQSQIQAIIGGGKNYTAVWSNYSEASAKYPAPLLVTGQYEVGNHNNNLAIAEELIFTKNSTGTYNYLLHIYSNSGVFEGNRTVDGMTYNYQENTGKPSQGIPSQINLIGVKGDVGILVNYDNNSATFPSVSSLASEIAGNIP